MAVKKKAALMSRKKRVKKSGKDSVHKRHCYKSSPLLSMGDAFPDEVDPEWTIVIAREPFWFNISVENIKKAIPGDPRFCVVALALDDAMGGMFDYQIGAGITKIFDIDKKIEVRFKTPGCLQRQMRKFDRLNGKWKLPPGMYRLHPMPTSWREVVGPKGKKKRKERAAAKRNAIKPLRTRIARKHRAPVTRLVLRHGGVKRLAALMAG
jgi:hypothetical protein